MQEKIKIAIIGCGRFSPFFVPLFKAHPFVEKVYVCDLKRERAEDFSKRFDVEIIDSFEEALVSDKINSKDVTSQLQPESITELINANYEDAIQKIADGAGFLEASPIQPLERLPETFKGIHNAHNGTHHFLIDDFCRAVETGKLSPTNIWQAARYNIPGLIAHQSALRGGMVMDVPDLGNSPENWEVL